MKLRIALILSFLIGQLIVTAQVQLVLLDGDSGSPVDGATVFIAGITGNSSDFGISDSQGGVQFSVAFPVIYKVQHVAYKTKVDTIYQEGVFEVELAKSLTQLSDVVVTGQYEASSARKSVYQVKSISQQRIADQSAVSIQDVLSRELNIRFNRDNAVGSSNIILQGLSGQNVKVLLDGVPLVGRSGTANEIDLNQIDINTIERIEIVEGPMSVNYGADALAGVINLISKKDIPHRMNLKLAIQQESIGREYSLWQNGIHDYSVTASYNPTNRWFAQMNTRVKRFGGWIGGGDDRNKEWYPKDQWFNGGTVRYQGDQWAISYQLNLMKETIYNLGIVNDANPLKDPYAIDEEYLSHRWMQTLDVTRDFDKSALNTVISYTDYKRRTYQYNHNLVTDREAITTPSEQDTIAFLNLFLRSTLSDPIRFTAGSIQVHSQLGLEGTYDQSEGTTLSQGTKDQWNAAVFGSAEAAVGKIKIRPGIRVSYNSVYPSIPTPSVNFSYAISKQLNLRAGYGRGYRAPSIKELYHEFIDSNHHLIGNDQLKPEYSHNLTTSLAFAKGGFNASVNGFYNHIDNRITYFTPQQANQATSYLNLDLFKTTGASMTSSLQRGQLSLQLGLGTVGRYQELSEDTGEVPEFLFSPEINSTINYQWGKSGIKTNLLIKYIGATKQYQLTDSEEAIPELVSVDDYTFADFTISKAVFKELKLSAGVRNLLDVTTINSSLTSGAHGGAGSAVSYGRSYFFNLNYSINTTN